MEDKQEMLDKIKELSFQIYEDVVQKYVQLEKNMKQSSSDKDVNRI